MTGINRLTELRAIRRRAPSTKIKPLAPRRQLQQMHRRSTARRHDAEIALRKRASNERRDDSEILHFGYFSRAMTKAIVAVKVLFRCESASN